MSYHMLGIDFTVFFSLKACLSFFFYQKKEKKKKGDAVYFFFLFFLTAFQISHVFLTDILVFVL